MLSPKTAALALIPVVVIGATAFLGWKHMARMGADILS